MMTNRELFYRDPTETKIPNDGVAKVVRPETDQQWDVLRWELRSFVCEGQYAQGLERILDSFLANLGQAQQPAAWVSGFYGSGKSHLVRVLEYLWRDVEMPGGDRVRDLVTLPDEIRDHLTELSTAGKRLGGLWSAAGTLASGKSDAVRLAFLSVLFESAGLPEEYARARFTIWAQENGYLDGVRAAVEAEGRALDKEIHDLYVSPVIAKALLDADSTLGASVKDVRDLLKTQFPPTTKDVTDDEMFDVMDDVLRLQSATTGRAVGPVPLRPPPLRPRWWVITHPGCQQWVGQRPPARFGLPGDPQVSQPNKRVVDALRIGRDGMWPQPDTRRGYHRLSQGMHAAQQIPLTSGGDSRHAPELAPAREGTGVNFFTLDGGEIDRAPRQFRDP